MADDLKKYIRNMLENILTYLSKKNKEWYKENHYDDCEDDDEVDWINLPPLVTNGEKKLVKLILDLNDKLEINKLNQSSINLLNFIHPDFSV